jgi:hypothetical protein
VFRWSSASVHGQHSSDEQVREIRRRYAEGGVSTHDLAQEYPVTAMVVWKVVTGRSYADVP